MRVHAGAADAMAEKEQEEAELAAASAVMFDDRPPGPVSTPDNCAGDDEQQPA